ncbi:hypothetical protein [Streptomyces sp. ISL-100]|uniref:hypothetical protein n=1 Tax=Streptomyces sp. ISL-100 TaxID=2819173 RepID=UPI001BE82AEA|nr:hypothetical protein [Streptomyces sp. ISL-100]MBT2399350.1 hypothetical protein [Streptomyces sp. ISL-100]
MSTRFLTLLNCSVAALAAVLLIASPERPTAYEVRANAPSVQPAPYSWAWD